MGLLAIEAFPKGLLGQIRLEVATEEQVKFLVEIRFRPNLHQLQEVNIILKEAQDQIVAGAPETDKNFISKIKAPLLLN